MMNTNLLQPLDVEELVEELLPHVHLPPPLVAALHLPPFSNLDHLHVGPKQKTVGCGTDTKVIDLLSPWLALPHLNVLDPVSLDHLGEEDVLGEEGEVNGSAKVNKLK